MAVNDGVTDGPGDVPLVGVGDVLALPHRRGDTVGVAHLRNRVVVMEVITSLSYISYKMEVITSINGLSWNNRQTLSDNW